MLSVAPAAPAAALLRILQPGRLMRQCRNASGSKEERKHMELPQYGSPRGPSLVSPGLTLRTGKTPRPEPGVQQGPASRAFEFHDFQQAPYDEPPKRKSASGQSRLMEYAFTITVGVVLFMIFVILVLSGDRIDGHGKPATPAGIAGKPRGLRGESAGSIVTSDGSRIALKKQDHHKSRVLQVPALAAFSRRNVRHFSKFDAKGRPVEEEEEKAGKTVKAEEAGAAGTKRRMATPSSDVVMKRNVTGAGNAVSSFLPPFKTSGVVRAFHSITGVDQYHHFDVNDYFGSSVSLMKAETHTVTVAVGAPGALENSGVIYFLNINADGGVDSYTYLSSADDSLGDYWGPNVALGWTVENIGDLDGDGVQDLAVGAIGYPAGTSHGAVYILFLTPDNKIKNYRVITTGESGFTHTLKDNACLGSSIAKIGDLDGDGVTELAVGAMGLGKQRGAVFILYLNRDGSVKKSTVISSMQGWDHKLNVEDQFGHAVRAIGDLDGDGVTELAVGADGFPSGEFYGTVYILFMRADGTIKNWRRIDELDHELEPEFLFGGSIDTMGDLDGDGVAELIIGAPGANDFRGDAYLLSMNRDGTVKSYKSLVDKRGVMNEMVKEEDEFAWSIGVLGDMDGDGIPEIAIGAETSPYDRNYGSLHLIFLEANNLDMTKK